MAFYLYGDICTYQNGLAIGLSYYNFASIVGAEIKEFGKFFIKWKKRVADAEKKRFRSLFSQDNNRYVNIFQDFLHSVCTYDRSTRL